jgi:hypothetical protein
MTEEKEAPRPLDWALVRKDGRSAMLVSVPFLALVPSFDRFFRWHPVLHLGRYSRPVPGARVRMSYRSFSSLCQLFGTDLVLVCRPLGSSSVASAARTSSIAERYNLNNDTRQHTLSVVQVSSQVATWEHYLVLDAAYSRSYPTAALYARSSA